MWDRMSQALVALLQSERLHEVVVLVEEAETRIQEAAGVETLVVKVVEGGLAA